MPSEYRYDRVDKYIIRAELTEPMHVGGSKDTPEAVLLRPSTGKPFIQAAGIAGVFRSYWHPEGDTEMILMGESFSENTASFGRLKFTDGEFGYSGPVMMELRPHVRLNPETGSVSSSTIKGTTARAGHKFNCEYIGTGTGLEFCIYLFSRGEDLWAEERLMEAFRAIDNGEILFGGKKSSGCGRVKIEELRRKSFDLRKKEERLLWADEESLAPDAYEIMRVSYGHGESRKLAYKVFLSGRTDSLLVRCIAVPEVGKDAPDAMNIQNARGDYIIPGSSLKGVLRSRMEKIAGYLAGRQRNGEAGKQRILEQAFGAEGSRKEAGKAGNIRFRDTVVGDAATNAKARLQHRIHIDKFTGGVMNGPLFSEKNVSGPLIMEIDIENKKNPKETLGLLVLALRDLAAGQVSIGSGYGIGHGFIRAEKMTVVRTADGAEAAIVFESDASGVSGGSVKDDGGMLADSLSSLQEVWR